MPLEDLDTVGSDLEQLAQKRDQRATLNDEIQALVDALPTRIVPVLDEIPANRAWQVGDLVIRGRANATQQFQVIRLVRRSAEEQELGSRVRAWLAERNLIA